MLHIGNAKVPVCSGMTRRSFLQAGSAGLLGLNLPDFLRMRAAGAVDDSKADVKNCIMLFLVGSPGHLDTWDLKPDAPANYRGPFKPIDTKVPGIRICEHMPLMAKLGVLAFWRSTGKWADFCEDPDRPYDCRAVASVSANCWTLSCAWAP